VFFKLVLLMLQQPEPAGRGIQEAVVVQAQEQEF